MKELIDKLAKKLSVSKKTVFGIALVFFGGVLSGADKIAESTSHIGEFFTGLSTGLSVGIMVVGVCVILSSIAKPSAS